MEKTVIFVVLAAFLQGVQCQISMDPKVNITETVPPSEGLRVRGTIAQDVTLNCHVEHLTEFTTVWWQRTSFDKSGTETQSILISGDMDSQDVNKWSIEKPTPFSWRLRIKALQVQDEGNYTCYVDLTYETRAEANRTVIVTSPPLVIEEHTSSDTIAREGETLELKCNATGRPTPTVLWRREGNAILPGGGVIRLDSTLKISSLEYTHQGRYFCEAVNEAGDTFRDIILTVQYTPKIEPGEARGYGQAIGYKRTLACLIDANPQPNSAPDSTQLVWIKGSMAMQPDGERIYTRVITGAYNRMTFELVFKMVEEGDYGKYTCRARNNMGQAQTDVTLFQTEEPQPDKGYLSSSNYVSLSASLLITVSLSHVIITALQGLH